MTLSTLAILLGLGVAIPQVFALSRPARFRESARAFPRSESWGYGLMLLGTAWFLWNLKNENISDFAAYKSMMLVGFALVGIGACIFLRDFLAVRGLAIVLLLLAKVMVDTARWVDTSWRLVIVVWAYLLVVAGIWFTVSPWRMRDLVDWATETDSRIRVMSAVRLAFGIFVLILGMTVFRQTDTTSRAQFAPSPATASVPFDPTRL